MSPVRVVAEAYTRPLTGPTGKTRRLVARRRVYERVWSLVTREGVCPVREGCRRYCFKREPHRDTLCPYLLRWRWIDGTKHEVTCLRRTKQ